MSAAAMPMSCPPTAELIAAVQRADSSQVRPGAGSKKRLLPSLTMTDPA